MLTRAELTVSAGSGPSPARELVRLLAAELKRQCAIDGISVRSVVGEGDPPRTVRLLVEGPLALLEARLGTHTLVQPQAGFSRSRRKRWHVSVRLVAHGEPQPLRRDEVKVSVARAGGPGGQHVNKTQSAVRLLHVPTGVEVVARERRSQQQNRKRAFLRLEAELQQREASARAGQRQQEHWQRRDVIRGNAVTVWKLMKGKLECVKTCSK